MADSARSLGKYELQDRIGTGGMAEVYKATSSGTEGFKKTVCIKRILPQFAADPTFVEMLVAEAKVTSQLHHANVGQVYDLQQEDGTYYLVMEYVDGCDLLRVLTSMARQKTRLELPVVLHMIAEVAKGLDYAHHASNDEGQPLNIVHRDVSPSNILLSRAGEVKVVDFGVARADGTTSQDDQRRAGALQGKLGYMSPELVTHKGADHRSDIFALGIVLFEALTLRRLFLGRSQVETLINVRDVRLEKKLRRHGYIPEAVQDILRCALAPNPEDRYSRARDFHDALTDYLFTTRHRITSRDVAEVVSRVLALPASDAPEKKEAPKKRRHATERPQLTADTDVFPSPFHQSPATTPTGKESPWEVFHTRAKPSDPKSIQSASIRLRGQDEKPFGPVTYDNLLRLIASGSVSEEEEASVDGGPWLSLMELDLPELQTLKKNPLGCEPDVEGPLNPLRAPQLFHELSVGRVTGKLEVTRGRSRKEVFFREGLVVSVTSTLKSELLANFMRAHHLISSQQVDDALAAVEKRGGRLGQTLVAKGIIKWEDLSRILRQQFRYRFVKLFAWTDAWYAFYADEAPVDAELPFIEETMPLIARAVRTQYGRIAVGEILAPFEDHTLVWDKDQAGLGRFRLTPPEEAVVEQFVSGQRLGDLLDLFTDKQDHRSAGQMVLLLHQTGALRLEPPQGLS